MGTPFLRIKYDDRDKCPWTLYYGFYGRIWGRFRTLGAAKRSQKRVEELLTAYKNHLDKQRT